MRKTLIAMAFSAMLAGCGGREPLQSTPTLQVVEGAAGLPAPARADLTVGDRPSLIGPLDTIGVDVFNVPELSREVQVDAGMGMI